MEFNELQQIVESTARSIQALSDTVAEMRLTQEEINLNAASERQELRDAMLRLERVAEGVVNLVGSLDEDRPTILGRLSRIENKVDRLLERGN